MAEVAELIRRLDTSTSAAVNEVRIIQLEHSLAQDVAAILQSAIGAGHCKALSRAFKVCPARRRRRAGASGAWADCRASNAPPCSAS